MEITVRFSGVSLLKKKGNDFWKAGLPEGYGLVYLRWYLLKKYCDLFKLGNNFSHKGENTLS